MALPSLPPSSLSLHVLALVDTPRCLPQLLLTTHTNHQRSTPTHKGGRNPLGADTMLRASTPLLRLTGLSFVLHRRSLPRGGVVATPHYAVRRSAFAVGTTSISSFHPPLALCVRRSSTTARSSRWRSSKIARSWRERRASSSSAAVKHQKASRPRVVPKPRGQSTSTGVKTRKKARGSLKKKRLSAHQRQAMKYNKRVEAIARLWKEQQQQQKQSSRKRLEKSLSSRLK